MSSRSELKLMVNFLTTVSFVSENFVAIFRIGFSDEVVNYFSFYVLSLFFFSDMAVE